MAPKNNNAQEIAAAVALELAKNTAATATDVAKTAAAAAAEVAKTAASTALVVSSVSNDVQYIRSQLQSLNEKFEKLGTVFASKEEHESLLKSFDEYRKKVDMLSQRIWVASGGLTVLVFVLKFLMKDF